MSCLGAINMTLLAQSIRDINERGDLAIGIYTVLGYPNILRSRQALETLRQANVTFFETAIPVSSGWSEETNAVIRKAHQVALTAGVGKDAIISTFARYRPNLYIVYEPPLVNTFESLATMLQGNVDCILFESDPGDYIALRKIAHEHQLGLAQAVTPRMRAEEISELAKVADDIVYVTCAPRTGGRQYDRLELQRTIEIVLQANEHVLACCGFGIRTPDDIMNIGSLRGCSGVLVGTAALQALSRGVDYFASYLNALTVACHGLKAEKLSSLGIDGQ